MKTTVELRLWSVSLFFQRQGDDDNGNSFQHTLDVMSAMDEESCVGAAIIKAGQDGVGGLNNGFMLCGYQIVEITQHIMKQHNSAMDVNFAIDKANKAKGVN